MGSLRARRHPNDDDETSAREAYRFHLQAGNRRRDAGVRKTFEPSHFVRGTPGQGGKAQSDAAYCGQSV